MTELQEIVSMTKLQEIVSWGVVDKPVCLSVSHKHRKLGGQNHSYTFSMGNQGGGGLG